MDSGFVSNAPLIRTPGIRTKLHTLLHRPSETSAGRYLRIATFIVILLSTLCFVLQSIPSCHSFAGGFAVIDGLVAVAFTIEYVIKFVVVPDGRGDEENDGDNRPPPTTVWVARLRFACEPMSIVDILSFGPWWLTVWFSSSGGWFLQILRSLRLIRILRTLRLAQESSELRILVACVSHALPALRMLSFFLVLELLIVGGIVFYVERGNGPPDPVNGKWMYSAADPLGQGGEEAIFQSIPDAMWFVLVTVTTVGYGQEVPATVWGKIFAAVAMLTGLVGISSIISIIGAEFKGLRDSGVYNITRRVDPTAGPVSATAGLMSGTGATPLRLPPMGSGNGGGGGSGKLDERIDELKRLLSSQRQQYSDDPSKAAALTALEDAAVASLNAFMQLTLQGSGIAVEAAAATTTTATVAPLQMPPQPKVEPASSSM